ncbi:MAG: hypothetical protein ACE5F6_14730 [Anaerolineae bacterium]
MRRRSGMENSAIGHDPNLLRLMAVLITLASSTDDTGPLKRTTRVSAGNSGYPDSRSGRQ